ncbi:class E sortase [Streptomyces sp. Ac-502]|uniref:class E sortase n=1 Tax=Streptomyces sp. Ac-502 TaxID=3342801 RepID=UPI0038621F2B
MVHRPARHRVPGRRRRAARQNREATAVRERQVLRRDVHPAVRRRLEQARTGGHRDGRPEEGLGHYDRTARLGGTGNFAVAGHRRTYGDPFKDFPELRPGDAVVLTDGATWYTYRIDRRPYTTVPTDIGVIDPLPRKSGYNGPGRYLTLTTCEPEWGHSHRLIVWAHLDSTQPVERGRPSALTG